MIEMVFVHVSCIISLKQITRAAAFYIDSDREFQIHKMDCTSTRQVLCYVERVTDIWKIFCGCVDWADFAGEDDALVDWMDMMSTFWTYFFFYTILFFFSIFLGAPYTIVYE